MNASKAAQLFAIRKTLQLMYTELGYVFPPLDSALDDGTLVVGPEEVMHSSAGFYIGQRCFEWKSDGELWLGEWLGPLPYERHTDYMSAESANALLALEHKMSAENFGVPGNPELSREVANNADVVH